jgi:DNA repair protein RecN (Recombination protein N)
VIRSLEVRDLVVIERAELAPPAGLTAITGETGAGKTVLAQALALLAGAPADAGAVRPGARHALVQATLALPDGFWDRLEEDDPAAALRELADDESEVVIARRVPAEGRARALVDGQAAPREAVAALARALIRFSAQHEHRRLVSPASQLAVLDAFAGPDVVAAAERLAALRRRLRGLDRALATARARREAAERERAELEELVAAVDAARLDVEEEEALLAERARLRHAEGLAAGAAAAAEALSPGEGAGDEPGAVAAVGGAARALEPLVPVDPALAGPHRDLADAEAALQEVALALRAYLHDLDAEPGRLAQIEERLEAYSQLGRRHGPGTAVVIARAETAREALRGLDEGAGEVLALAEERAAALDEAVGVAAWLRQARAEAAPRLADAVRDELADLAMPRAELRIELVEDDAELPDDSCVVWLRANPGLAEAPLAATASGGELSRVLLALHGVAAAREDATWVLDEVDAGIGGVTAAAVGARLRALAEGRQAVVITHLPQVAAMADAHYRLVKGLDDAGRATTRIEPVEGEELIVELCRMLGASASDRGARRHAEELLSRRASAER